AATSGARLIAPRGPAPRRPMYLLETNIVSELFAPLPNAAVLAWLGAQSDDNLAISAVTVGELQRGAELIRAHKPDRASAIDRWIAQVRARYNALPMDADAFVVWAKLMFGRDARLVLDAMIAAIAVTNGLTVATRNVRNFKALGAKTYNPFDPRGQDGRTA
ncbi:MAG: type II toxin-antitoxin system VapC family toxin, partial [Rhodospirillaceae bacterium]|nr:type II toxin-antitoxin system VapC family toxin [Rhodospirillaceae bacterium]